jgi:hypothetical protein
MTANPVPNCLRSGSEIRIDVPMYFAQSFRTVLVAREVD